MTIQWDLGSLLISDILLELHDDEKLVIIFNVCIYLSRTDSDTLNSLSQIYCRYQVSLNMLKGKIEI